MIDLNLLDKLIEENKIKQTFQLQEINKNMELKWNNDKYYFDVEESIRVYKYISLLKNDKGTSRKFNILRFQFEIIIEEGMYEKYMYIKTESKLYLAL